MRHAEGEKLKKSAQGARIPMFCKEILPALYDYPTIIHFPVVPPSRTNLSCARN